MLSMPRFLSRSLPPAFALLSLLVPLRASGQEAGPALQDLQATVATHDEKLAAIEVRVSKSKYPFSLGGFLKLDALYSSARVNTTDAPRWALLEPATQDGDDGFHMTVQHSRLTGKWDAPAATWEPVGAVKVDGLLELDLFNLGDTGDSKYTMAQLRLRLLYVELKLSDWNLTLRAGQDWDLFSPLNANTLNTNGNYWFGGNAGFRRPQLALRQVCDLGGAHKWTTALSANANVGVTRTVGAGASARTLNTGEDYGLPVAEVLLEYGFPLGENRSGAVGLSGLAGAEDLEGVDGAVEQLAIAFHLVLPILEFLSLRGELHYGENTDAFLMGGGMNTANGKAIEAASGWMGIECKASKAITFNALYGHEKISDSDLSAGARNRNQLFGANVQYSPFESIVLGLEYTHFRTGFDRAQNAASNVFWGSLIFKY